MIGCPAIFDEARTPLTEPLVIGSAVSWLQLVDDAGGDVLVQLPDATERTVVLEPWQPLCFGQPLERVRITRADALEKLPGDVRIRYGLTCPPPASRPPGRIVLQVSDTIEAPGSGAWTSIGGAVLFADTSSARVWQRFPDGLLGMSDSVGDHSLRLVDFHNGIPIPLQTKAADGGGVRWASRVHFAQAVSNAQLQVRSNTGADLNIGAQLWFRYS